MTAAERPAASIWLRPERSAAGRPAQWSRAEITQVALRIADAEGLDAVTMRRVAAELGTGAASLYRYVQTREDRERLVYSVEVRVPNLDMRLRSGMPVEVAIEGSWQ